ncbi:hypothetical protein HY407_04365 [Candidatus Gottesmanbacteria bacterium]|nr:hypothetical protein [Candidatus Gottesmanbacteria bacterium]
MAIVDLAKYDLLDLLISSIYSDDKKGEWMYDYMQAFSVYLSEQVGDRLTEADNEEMKKLLMDPEVSPEKIEDFYRARISNYDSYLLAATLVFKKTYIVNYYKNMALATKVQQDPSAVLWEKLVKEAEADNWDEVAKLCEQMDREYMTPSAKAQTNL